MNRGAWQAKVHGVTKSQTWLNDNTFTFIFAYIFPFTSEMYTFICFYVAVQCTFISIYRTPISTSCKVRLVVNKILCFCLESFIFPWPLKIYLFLAIRGLCCSARASHCGGFFCCGAWALENRLNSCGMRAELLHSMWDLPQIWDWNHVSALAGEFFTTEPPGKPFPWLLQESFARYS